MSEDITFEDIADGAAGLPGNRLARDDILRILLGALWRGEFPEDAIGFRDPLCDSDTRERIDAAGCLIDAPGLETSGYRTRWAILELVVAREPDFMWPPSMDRLPDQKQFSFIADRGLPRTSRGVAVIEQIVITKPAIRAWAEKTRKPWGLELLDRALAMAITPSPLSSQEIERLYVARLNESRQAHGHPPTRQQDAEWARNLGIPRETTRDLRRVLLTDEEHKQGKRKAK